MNLLHLFRRSVAGKLVLLVTLALLFVIVFYTYLVMDMRESWLSERMMLSRTVVQSNVFEYFVHTGEAHARVQTENFLARLAEKAGAASIELAPPGEVHPETAKAPPLAEITLASLGAFGSVSMPTIDSSGSGPSERTWQVRVPLKGGPYCTSCHDTPQDRQMAGIVINYPQTLLRQVQNNERMRLIKYAGLLLLIVMVILVLITWRIVLDPLYQLASAFDRVGRGEQGVACNIDSADQFGQLAAGFNRMLRQIQLRQRTIKDGYEHQIAHADRLATVGQLASGLAHEIKNPLHSVSAALSVLCRRTADPMVKEVGGEMNEQLQRVTRILNDLLRYARPTEPQCSIIDLQPVVDKTVALLRAQADPRGITIEATTHAGPCCIWGDWEKMTQILLNLALNSIQACTEGDVVTIRLHCDEQGCHLDVRDTGPGIPEEMRDRIFDPFFTTKQDGNGLGLAITRTLVEQNGGEIELLLPEANSGACFRISFPPYQAALPPAEPSA